MGSVVMRDMNPTLNIALATAIYMALNNGRQPSADFFTTHCTGGADYLLAAQAANDILNDPEMLMYVAALEPFEAAGIV